MQSVNEYVLPIEKLKDFGRKQLYLDPGSSQYVSTLQAKWNDSDKNLFNFIKDHENDDDCYDLNQSSVIFKISDYTFITQLYDYDANKGGEYDMLEDGWYLIFDKNVLFITKRTKPADFLATHKLMPFDASWIED